MFSYSAFLVRFYWLVLLVTTIVAVVCIAVAFTTKDFPSLDDPTVGFESRGTEIRGRADAIDNLFESSDVTHRLNELNIFNVDQRKRRKRQNDAITGPPMSSDVTSLRHREKRQLPDECFTSPGYYEDQFKLVFESTSGASLWTLEDIQEMCAMDRSIVLTSQYVRNSTCPSHSIGHYIAWIHQRESCEQITEQDVSATLQLLKNCSDDYYASWDQGKNYIISLIPDCWLPPVYHLLNDLTDSGFLGRNSRHNDHLTYAAMWLNLQRDSDRDFYLEQIHSGDLKGTYVEITAVDVSWGRFRIFSYLLFQEMTFLIVGLSLIFVIMGLYLRSFLITIFTLFDVVFSFGIAYFLYMVVFNIPHFPFLGFLSNLILIATAADDIFILYDAFEQAKAKNPDKDIEYWMSQTMNNAAISILVTSLTTSAALYANPCERYY